MSLPYYKRFPRDFLEGIIGLSFEEKGAYGIVLDLIYMRDGSLPDDPRYIAGQLGCSVRMWSKIKLSLVEKGKLSIHDGVISNFRANYLLEETKKYQDKQSENRTNGNKNKEIKKPPNNHSRDYKEPDKEEYKKQTKMEVKDTYFEDCWSAYPHVKTRMSKSKALEQFRKLPPAEQSNLSQAIEAFEQNLKDRDREFVPAMERWLRDGKHRAFFPADSPKADRATLIRAYRHTGSWRPEWGEMPTKEELAA